MLTTEQIEVKLNNLDQKIKGVVVLIERLSSDISAKTNITDLNRNVSELRDLIKDNATFIGSLEEKLAKIILPEETRYYLNEGEVSSFQSNFNTLKAMMNKMDTLYKNIVNYQSNLMNA
ncbi:MAG: hypothetical protein M0R17_02565 [Candidatus Omnitrophica bacterium]|jgi:Mg2+ and Co2+ transporter CorA|nr:hypothetical protein [Candidatus Omnitrophota bacterium]